MSAQKTDRYKFGSSNFKLEYSEDKEDDSDLEASSIARVENKYIR